MKIRLQYMAQLRTVVGRAEEDIDLLEGASVSDLLVHLADKHVAARTHLVTETKQARPSLLIVVNNAAVSAREAANTTLHLEDIVTLLPPIAGG